MAEEFSEFRFTPVFWKNRDAWKSDGCRYVVNQGGTSSSKSISVIQLLYFIAKNNHALTISVVSETIPHLKKGVLRDFEKMLKQSGAYQDVTHNQTDNIFRFQSGSMIEFFSADNYGKVHGPRRDVLFLNECQNVKYEIFEQLEIRTRLKIFLDFNPVREFWAHKEVLPLKNAVFIKSTYRDNPYLPPQIRQSIEAKMHKSNWWRVYGEGEVGMIEGLVFPDITLVDEMPKDWKMRATGLDFGYTNDPTAAVDIALHAGALWLDELVYETGLTNPMISKRLKDVNHPRNQRIVADSSEPKSVTELRSEGWDVIGAIKGPDSVNYGISVLQQYPINVTKKSVNLITEFRNYTWEKDKDGKLINEPIDEFNHGIDAGRYVAQTLIKKRTRGLTRAN